MDKKVLLFDLDGTLLRSDKTISERTLLALEKCREKGILIGVSTSRGEKNSLQFIEKLCPDILIASGGALVTYKGQYIYKAEFSIEETQKMMLGATGGVISIIIVVMAIYMIVTGTKKLKSLRSEVKNG